MGVVGSIHAPRLRKRLAARQVKLLSLFVSVVSLFVAHPASAEISSEIELKSDDRFRGRSLSGGEPVIDADVSIDTNSGIYAGASVTVTLSGKSRAGLQGVDAYVGFAKRINKDVTIDVGVAAYAFTQRYSGNFDDRYAELYAGASSGGFAAYLHYTPSYFGKSVPVLYADLNFTRRVGADFTVKAHVGLLAQTSGPPRLADRKTRYDTRLAMSHPLLGLEAEAAWVYAGRDDLYFDGPWAGNSAIVFSISKHF